MTMRVSRQLHIDFKVNGTTIPMGLGSFQNLSIIESTTQKLPTLEFTFKDPDNSLHDLSQLVDGAKIDIVLHNDVGFERDPPQQVTFLCMGSKAKIQGSSLIFTSGGIYNAAKFLGGVVKGGYKGTSAEVVEKLAKEAGLKASVLKGAQDKMFWMPSRETYSDFIRNVISHGYTGEKSITSMAVDTTGTLHYKDLSTLAGQSPSNRVVSGSPELIKRGVIPCLGYEVLDMSGMNNFMSGYGTKLVQEKMEGNSEDFLSSATTMFSNFLSINTGIRDLIGGVVRSEYLPPDLGNQHKNFHKAEYQNKKGKGTFSNRIEFVTSCATGLKLYDVFAFEPVLPTNNKVSDLWSGNYIVAAKTKFLGNGAQYYEKVRGVSQGYGSNFGGGLLGAS